ncbi:hypothetical protein C2857_007343 [Epichloe festucae Fl1]|uniref:Uncharacterized protein n=1 Tax=Epichloe festucae (strain Fl1) TaxID=877507 RepID=A0A7S9KM92_EPIFF|nr:hypothetical protein C2857_007343 [Epichloe festucae Fl1]
MRLYLLPLSTRRTFLYAQRLHMTTTTPADASYIDRAAAWAARKWSDWEKKESGWQKKVVEKGNHAFRRIPYEEWGLKSVPPLSSRRRKGEMLQGQGQEHVELVFPRALMSEAEAEHVVRKMGSERDALHRKKLIWIPNLPFFYLVYRAWSHWRAIAGGKHIQWLVDKKLLRPTASTALDTLYSQASTPLPQTQAHKNPGSGSGSEPKELLLLTQAQVRTCSEKLNLPALEIELERAIWQVEQAIEKDDKNAAAMESKSKIEDKDGKDGKEKYS